MKNLLNELINSIASCSWACKKTKKKRSLQLLSTTIVCFAKWYRFSLFSLQTDILLVSCDLVTDLALHLLADVHRTYDASLTMLLASAPDAKELAVPGGKANRKVGKRINKLAYSTKLPYSTRSANSQLDKFFGQNIDLIRGPPSTSGLRGWSTTTSTATLYTVTGL